MAGKQDKNKKRHRLLTIQLHMLDLELDFPIFLNIPQFLIIHVLVRYENKVGS